MGNTPLGDGDTFTTSRIASLAWSLTVYRKTAKAANLYPVSTNQRSGHRINDGIDSCLDITLCKLTKPSGKVSNQIGAVHSAVYGVGGRLNTSVVDCMGTKNHHCHEVGARWESDPP